MGRGQRRDSGDVCVEVLAKGKAHCVNNMVDSEVQRMARLRRVVCWSLFTALLTFMSYVVYLNSGQVLSQTPFLQEQLAPDGTSPLTEGTGLEGGRGDFRPTSRDGDGDEAKGSGLEVEQVELGGKDPRALNGSADSALPDLAIGGDSGRNVSSEAPSPAVNSSDLLEESFQNNTKEADASSPTSLVQSSEKSNTGECDLGQGEWVPDSRPPMYKSSTCRYIQGFQNCAMNGRPDDGYLHWKWKPDRCEVPRIDASAFLPAMRNRSIVFAGDSIARNQFQSLLCVLAQVEDPEDVYHSEDGRNHVYLFPSYNFTLKMHWAPYLVRVEDKPYTWPDNKTNTVTHVYLDELAEVWVKAAVGADILHLSTGQWWYKRGVYLEKGKVIGWHDNPTREDDFGFAKPYAMGIANILKGSLSIPGFNGTTVYRSFAPDHFEGGDWNTGGSCNRTTPGGVPLAYLAEWMYSIQIKQFKNVTEELDLAARNRLKMLDITNLSQIRGDGHPNGYRTQRDKIADETGGIKYDCLHWCLPGPIDTWNDLLVESVRDVIFKR